jgi:hypothetical protein
MPTPRPTATPSPDGGRDTLRQLQEQIESFAPQWGNYPEHRHQLYEDLKEVPQPKDTETYGNSACEYILSTILSAYQEAQEKRNKQAYWREIKRVQRLIGEAEELLWAIRSSPLVRFSPDPDVSEPTLFYELHNAFCRHGRFKEVCTEIYGILIQSKAAWRAWYPDYLKKLEPGIDLRKAQPDNFCAREPIDLKTLPTRNPPLHPPIPALRKRGAPPNELQNLLLDTVFGCLRSANCKVKESLEYVTKIERAYFGYRAPTVQSLDRYRKRRRSKMKAQTHLA